MGIGLLIAVIALLPFGFVTKSSRETKPQLLPCYPDTVEVIEQQIVGCDTVYTTVGGIPNLVVTCRVIFCVPEGVDLNVGRGAK